MVAEIGLDRWTALAGAWIVVIAISGGMGFVNQRRRACDLTEAQLAARERVLTHMKLDVFRQVAKVVYSIPIVAFGVALVAKAPLGTAVYWTLASLAAGWLALFLGFCLLFANAWHRVKANRR